VISPRGEVLGELPPAQPGLLRVVIDTGDCGDWYLGQRREDVVRIVSAGGPGGSSPRASTA
jgi:hypothetical protein